MASASTSSTQVQRLTKYPLFFNELLKAVQPDDPAMPELIKAHKLVVRIHIHLHTACGRLSPAAHHHETCQIFRLTYLEAYLSVRTTLAQ